MLSMKDRGGLFEKSAKTFQVCPYNQQMPRDKYHAKKLERAVNAENLRLSFGEEQF